MKIKPVIKYLSALPDDATVENIVCKIGDKVLVMKTDNELRIPEDTVYLHDLPRSR